MQWLLYLTINFVLHKSFEKYENNHSIEKKAELIYTTEWRRQYIYLQQQHSLLESKKQDA